ncbi:helix-turn-helix domain-containing protein [Enterococcus casseliflavus]|uniref:helix-turn-helix domain-containing protein n=1 Tax=Enterococcus casseliflavus TaxID=37734 RepID=UPI0039A58E01
MARPPLNNFEKQLRKEISDNLKRITRGRTQAQISQMTGIPASTISGYFSQRSTIKEENVKKIAKAFGVPEIEIDPRFAHNYNFLNLKKDIMNDLSSGKKISESDFLELAKKTNDLGMSLSHMKTDRGNNITAVYHDTHDYNFFDTSVAAGLPTSIEAFEEDHVEQIAIPDYAMGKYSGMTDIFFTKTNGDSMNNVIPSGSLIAVKKIEDFSDLKNEDIVVFSNDNEFSVKRFFNDKQNKRLVFRPDSNNITFTDLIVKYDDAKDLRIYGKVVVYIVQL